MSQIPHSNWSNSFQYGFRECLRPSSVEELQEKVATSKRVKVVGSRHSFNAIVDGETAFVLDRIPLDPRIEDGGKLVSIGGHATYGDLATFLNGHGLAIHNVASLPHISIAGAVATATHGSGDGNGNLATAVAGLQFVAADGRLVDVRRGDADFEGMVVHLGALGPVARVILDVQPAFDVAQTVYRGLERSELIANLDAVMALGYSVSVFTDWSDSGSRLVVKSTDVSAIAPAALFGAARASENLHPIESIDASNTTEQRGIPGLWSDRLPHFKMGFTPSRGDEIQSEFHVPRPHARAALESVWSARDGFAEVVQIAELRTVAADNLWLSPQYQRDTLSIHFTWMKDVEAVASAVKVLEAALEPFDALPHWGKVFTTGPVGSRYPMLDRFKAIRDRMDPGGKFSNAFLEAVVFGKAAT